jgi:hypothetical protein
MVRFFKGKKYFRVYISLGILFIIVWIAVLIIFEEPITKSILSYHWNRKIKEIRRILRLEKPEIPPEEKRIREELILKKMEEINENQDLRSFIPEYPRPPKIEATTEEERLNLLRNSKEFQEMKDEFNQYLNKQEEILFEKEPPTPSSKDIIDLTNIRDRAAERIMDKLLTSKEKVHQDLPLEENINLGIKGPLASRKILYKPSLPKVNIKTEVEIEMMLFVTPSGIVDRVIPSIRGDSELERVAIQYLKQWRFAPLGKDQPQVEQWGTIPLKFKLQ